MNKPQSCSVTSLSSTGGPPVGWHQLWPLNTTSHWNNKCSLPFLLCLLMDFCASLNAGTQLLEGMLESNPDRAGGECTWSFTLYSHPPFNAVCLKAGCSMETFVTFPQILILVASDAYIYIDPCTKSGWCATPVDILCAGLNPSAPGKSEVSAVLMLLVLW